jgi:hypothetical protein
MRGCHARAVFTQSGQCYGRLVRDFLDGHEGCGGAVKITSAGKPRVTGRG